MFRLLSIGIDTISASVVLFPIIFILQRTLFKGRSFKQKVMTMLFAIYLSVVFSAVGIPNVSTLTFDLSLNIIPVIDIVSSPADYMENTVLNIILFIPIGFMLPIIWERFRFVKNTVLLGLGMSISVELLQIFTYRLTDIDDLVTNTIGTLIGYRMAEFINKKMADGFYLKEEMKNKKELLSIFVTVFLVMFLIEPFISGVLWAVILK